MRARTPLSTAPSSPLPNAFQAELDSFLLSCEADNLAPKTLRTYEEAVALLGRFLVDRAMPTEPAGIRREHVEAFIADQIARWRPNTARNRYLSLKRFFDWLAQEELTEASPMLRMRPPRVPEEPVPLLGEDAVRALLRACEGRLFNDRRDVALIRLLLDSGARRSEIAGLTVDAIDLREKTATVMGKGRRPRIITFGPRTAQALDRYLRERRTHRDAARPELWLGHNGPVRSDGIGDILERRSEAAGLPRIGAHAFRHLFAHTLLSAGMQETDLMRLAGWRSRQMVARYAASAGTDRAIAAYRRIAPSDKY
ncbi:MAG TPA: tyrosine-type recombinase/integrase [Candidatus Limnocylindrales bacterium]